MEAANLQLQEVRSADLSKEAQSTLLTLAWRTTLATDNFTWGDELDLGPVNKTKVVDRLIILVVGRRQAQPQPV
jgi:hypothetical protein